MAASNITNKGARTNFEQDELQYNFVSFRKFGFSPNRWLLKTSLARGQVFIRGPVNSSSLFEVMNNDLSRSMLSKFKVKTFEVNSPIQDWIFIYSNVANTLSTFNVERIEIDHFLFHKLFKFLDVATSGIGKHLSTQRWAFWASLYAHTHVRMSLNTFSKQHIVTRSQC